MPKTAIGLFRPGQSVEPVIREIEALGIPPNEIRVLAEPRTFEITDPMSFPRLDFEVELRRDLARLHATRIEAEAYLEGLRRGGTMVLATGADQDAKVDEAVHIMNRYSAIGLEETFGPEPSLPRVPHPGASHSGTMVLAGRVRQSNGACAFVW